MKKLVLISLMSATVAFALTTYQKGVEIQALTRASPMNDAPTSSEDISLSGVKKVRISLCSCTSSACTTFPDPGPATPNKNGWFTGGSVAVYYKNPITGTYMENLGLKQAIPVTDGGCLVFPDIESPAGNQPGMRMAAAAEGVTQVYTDGGNFVKVMVEGITNE